MLGGENYEESLLASLEKVNDNGRKLNLEAAKTHMQESHEASKDIKAGGSAPVVITA